MAASAEGEAADGEREVLQQQLEATKASVAGALPPMTRPAACCLTWMLASGLCIDTVYE